MSKNQDRLMFLHSFDELMDIDRQREKDGFSRKIKIRKMLLGPGRVLVVPYVVEEKLLHGDFEPSGEVGDFDDMLGHGEGEVGDLIGQAPIEGHGEGDGDGDGEDGDDPQAGEGSGEHGIEGEAYEMGKKLSEDFELPNLEDKGKKVPTDEYIYDLTDRHKGSGQLLDKKETLKSIVRTNAALGIFDGKNPNFSEFVVGPRDKVYRILSREKVWKSQAVVFFLRDYSGSMYGEPTKAVVTQHLMIYAWLLVQYEGLVIPRFIVHDHESEEVPARRYFGANASGGTLIVSGYKKINEIVEGEALARDYNIYVFQGTDGDDFDDGSITLPELEKILSYVNRMGVTVLTNPYWMNQGRESRFEQYIKRSGFLEQRKKFLRMHLMSSQGVTDEQNVKAIKTLIAQD